MKERKMKEERRWDNAASVLYVLAFVIFIAAFFISNKELSKIVTILGWISIVYATGFKSISHSYAIMYLKEDIASISYAINKLAENVRQELYGTDEETPEEDTVEDDTEETVIVSPEDFERFKKGEMTQEELLGIKKAVDEVVHKIETDALTDKDVKTLHDSGAFCQASEIKEPLEEVVKTMR